MVIYILLGILAVLFLVFLVLYNQLVSKRQMVNNGWADIDVQLKRRADLIPSLIEVVKGYATHEKTTFEAVIARRNAALAAEDNVTRRAQEESGVSRDVSRLFALAEDYPDLKASAQFLKLQDELSDTEDKLSYARRFYNGAVREFNIAIETVPANMIAGPFGFHAAVYFEIEEADRALPSVDLGGEA
jgi:LemA protein